MSVTNNINDNGLSSEDQYLVEAANLGKMLRQCPKTESHSKQVNFFVFNHGTFMSGNKIDTVIENYNLIQKYVTLQMSVDDDEILS
jgi:hypothetical protein